MRWILRVFGLCLWILAAFGAVVVGTELWLRAQHTIDSQPSAVAATTRRGQFNRAYDPFRTQYLHPQYLFFFPFDPVERVGLSNDTVHLTVEGFRGPGPDQRRERRLAFLLGGSATFGDYASSDDTTISGYLNELQQEYFFVNAGVPSFISTQEMFRLAFEILAYEPELVVTYNGANDADVLINHQEEGGGLLTVGAPESFLRLSSLVSDIRGEARQRDYGLLPELQRWFRERHKSNRTAPHMAVITDDVLQAAVAKYLNNLNRMRDMTDGSGARFVSVFQAISGLHRNVPRDFESWTWQNDALKRFYVAALGNREPMLEFYDLSNVFDSYFDDVPVARDDNLTNDPVFVDGVHLTDRGNRLIAERLVALLTLGRSMDGR